MSKCRICKKEQRDEVLFLESSKCEICGEKGSFGACEDCVNIAWEMHDNTEHKSVEIV